MRFKLKKPTQKEFTLARECANVSIEHGINDGHSKRRMALAKCFRYLDPGTQLEEVKLELGKWLVANPGSSWGYSGERDDDGPCKVLVELNYKKIFHGEEMDNQWFSAQATAPNWNDALAKALIKVLKKVNK